MAMTNHDRVGKALELLRDGLAPYAEREFESLYPSKAQAEAQRFMGEERPAAKKPVAKWDAGALLKLMWEAWNDVFRRTLGPAERTLVRELRDVRNQWAHQETFSSDDAYRALDSATRLLTAVSAPQAEEAERLKMELLRLRFDEHVRTEKRKSASTTIEATTQGNVKPWREVVTPHPDVASGRYQQAEFAADLWQVHLNEGSDEYKDPVEFFRRTYLTESLRRLLVGAVSRLSGSGGDPVVQLQTNFGGGKTHSMLALFHLFSGRAPSELPGVDALMAEAGVKSIPQARRVVIVGNRISPGNPMTKPDGTVVRTLWGEMAWQLGGKKAYAKVKLDDQKGTSPGDRLRELFKEYGPCLILVDEWVAYARQLHDNSDLVGGSFETQFTFAQALTESAKLAKNCLLVISLPASDTAVSPHAQADDVEVGGSRGRDALDRLRNVIGRIESPWRPASAEEGFEIVRRRLFEPLAGPEKFKERDVCARAFADLYKAHKQEFPPECGDSDYEKRIRAAYPIHPEVFDRLYTDWSTLVKFQRTRGGLRLMATVIHSLWEKGDRSPLILPALIPIDEPQVQFELNRYLSDNWGPVIDKDVDGPGSLPLRLDSEISNLGKYSACRRVARVIYLGSAPTATAAHQGIEDRRIKLGCVMPGESPAIFGDALRRLGAVATYLYQDGTRYWYSTQPTVTKLAEDRAEQYKREPDRVIIELGKRLRQDLHKRGDFAKVHPLPSSSADIPDELETRLVVLGLDHPHSKDAESPAMAQSQKTLETRGTAPRLYRNTLVFLAADKIQMQDLDEAIRRFLAWESILQDREKLDLTPNQVRQAEAQRDVADNTVQARLPETYKWLLIPKQKSPHDTVHWEAIALSGRDELAVRASKRLRNDEQLITMFAPTSLRTELDNVPLWREDHVAVRQLVEDFARYLYLPRLSDPSVLVAAIRDGLGLISWQQESFAYADGYDEAARRYRGLRAGKPVNIQGPDAPGLLVKPEVAIMQLHAESAPPSSKSGDVQAPHASTTVDGEPGKAPEPGKHFAPTRPKRFHGTVTLDPTRMGRDAGRIAEEVVSHLVAQQGAEVRVTLEIEASIPGGASEQVVRTVMENCRTMKFSNQGFEEE
ncbi:MAG: ATP-binding protein [Myxococcales bacterium]|nr:ATP-binding protein [Myxococcales bacterium]